MNGFDIRAVTVASAVSWAKGEIHDTQLDASRPEIVFWNELDNLASYRAALIEIKRLNCPAMIVHACNPLVWRKLEREKSVCTFAEKIVWRDSAVSARRYVCPPVAFKAWLAKVRVF